MNASRAEIFALWKKKIPQVFQKRSRSGDLAARLAAPQSFIYKEMRGQLFPMNLQWETRKKRITTVPVRKQPKQQSFIDRKPRKIHNEKERSRRWRRKEEKKRVTGTKRKRKVLNRVASIIIDSWMFPIEEKHPIRGVAIEESAKVSLSFSISLSLSCQKDDANIYLKTHRWDI